MRKQQKQGKPLQELDIETSCCKVSRARAALWTVTASAHAPTRQLLQTDELSPTSPLRTALRTQAGAQIKGFVTGTTGLRRTKEVFMMLSISILQSKWGESYLKAEIKHTYRTLPFKFFFSLFFFFLSTFFCIINHFMCLSHGISFTNLWISRRMKGNATRE